MTTNRGLPPTAARSLRTTWLVILFAVVACSGTKQPLPNTPVPPRARRTGPMTPCEVLEERELGRCLDAAHVCATSDVRTCASAARALDGSGERVFPAKCHGTIIEKLSKATGGEATPLLDLLEHGSAEARAVTYRALGSAHSGALVDEIVASDHQASSRALVVAGTYVAAESARRKLAERPDADAALAATKSDSFGAGHDSRPTSAGVTVRSRPRPGLAEQLRSDDWEEVLEGASAVASTGPGGVQFRSALEAQRGHWSDIVRGCVALALDSIEARGTKRCPIRFECYDGRCPDHHGLHCKTSSRAVSWRFHQAGKQRELTLSRWPANATDLPDFAFAPATRLARSTVSAFVPTRMCFERTDATSAVAMSGGWLASLGDRLVFVRPSAKVDAVFPVGGHIVLTRRGTAVIVDDEGGARLVDRQSDGWTITPIHGLPWPPTGLALDEDDSVVVGSEEGISIVHPDGRLEVVDCDSP